MWVWGWWACRDPEPEPVASDADADADADADTDADSDADTDATVVTADCAVTDNALRVGCTATLAGPGAASLTLEAPGLPTRTFSVEADATDVDLLGWGLVADTDYTWRIGDRSGSVHTGALPSELAAATITTTGTSWGFDAVVHPLRCPSANWFTMIDGDGHIVWYEPNEVFFAAPMTGYDWNADARSLLTVNAQEYLEQHVSGAVLRSLAYGVDYDYPLHHDVVAWGAYRYLLFEHPVGGVTVDGVYVFEGDTLLGTFRLDDHYPVSGAGSGDWAHANGLRISDGGVLTLSLLNFDSVIGIDGDPASPTFLDPSWVAVGSGQSLPDPDYAAIPGPLEGFDGQHNASLVGDQLWLFDNRGQATSRAARFDLDAGAGTLSLDAAWSFDHTCENQGGALPLDLGGRGGVLATCGNTGDVWAFDEGATEPAWTLTADCHGEPTTLALTRAIPVTVR